MFGPPGGRKVANRERSLKSTVRPKLVQGQWTVWGDEDVHFGWLNVEANTDLEARGILPPALRAQAQVVEVRRYTPEEAKGGHS